MLRPALFCALLYLAFPAQAASVAEGRAFIQEQVADHGLAEVLDRIKYFKGLPRGTKDDVLAALNDPETARYMLARMGELGMTEREVPEHAQWVLRLVKQAAR